MSDDSDSDIGGWLVSIVFEHLIDIFHFLWDNCFMNFLVIPIARFLRLRSWVVAILLPLCSVILFWKISWIFGEEKEAGLQVAAANNVGKVEVVALDNDYVKIIPGVYSVFIYRDGLLEEGTKIAEIRKIKDNGFELVIASEYQPEFMALSLHGDCLEAENLGVGNIKYQKSLDKMVLTFKKGEMVWRFVK